MIVAGIIVPKRAVFSKTDNQSKRIATVLLGWVIPLVFLYYLLGTPMMLRLGIWP